MTDPSFARGDAPEIRLATYGTLSPGRANHHQLSGLEGRWLRGTVRGFLHQEGWGAALGYPGIVLAADGPQVEVDVFESHELSSHWERLDAFEGPGYERVAVNVSTDEGPLAACIYVLTPASAQRPGS
jgi:gamma-glutamylcyclotransferase (GGCT)/AIG2-like uncharacterized protein YtfP